MASTMGKVCTNGNFFGNPVTVSTVDTNCLAADQDRSLCLGTESKVCLGYPGSMLGKVCSYAVI